MHADASKRGRQIGIAGHLAGPAIEAPEFTEWAGCDVVSALGVAMNLGSAPKQREQARLDDNRLVVSRLVELADFARVAKDGELRFEFIDEIECGHRGVGPLRILSDVEQHFELAGHRTPTQTHHKAFGSWQRRQGIAIAGLLAQPIDGILNRIDGRLATEKSAA
jgi:hypothetical protein